MASNTSWTVVRSMLAGAVLLAGWSGTAAAGSGEAHDPEPAAAPEAEEAEEPAQPEEPSYVHRDTLQVGARADDLVGVALSATEGVTGYEDLQRRPILRPGELVETIPGVIATQHSGSGKANQYFLRGFNLDHGTDFSVRVDGMPVNMPSHGHGQGYIDLNFLIPELVSAARFRKGPYYADRGDFSAAGSVDMELLRELPAPFVSATGGSFGDGRLLFGQSFDFGEDDLLAAVDLFHSDGPWERDDDYDGGRALLRFSRGDAARGGSLTAMGYSADWLSTDQVPARAVDSGLIDRFGLIDPGPRGSTDRYSLSGEVHRGDENALARLGAYLVSYDFDLISNFTYQLEDPVDGDQFEQVDRRWVAGADFGWHRHTDWSGRRVEFGAGVDLRFDDIDNGLFRTRDLERVSVTRQDRIELWSGGPWVESEVQWSPKLATRAGLRAQLYHARVDSGLEANSGSEDDLLLSPKLTVILGPWNRTEVYLNGGWGFHSNDARGAVIAVDPVTGEPREPVTPLVRARGADIGLRTTAIPGLHSSLSAFVLELDSELVFVGDGGATEANRPSRRVGVELANHVQLRPWLMLDFDATLSDAEFSDRDPAGDEVPGAVETTFAAGLSVIDRRNFFGGLRWRYFGGAPLIEDGSVRSSASSLVNAQLGYDFPNGLTVALEVFNLFDREDSDIEYFYASRLSGEPLDGVEDVHFHPVESRSFRLRTTWRF